MVYNRTIQHTKRRLLIEAYNENNVLVARFICGRADIAENMTVLYGCENSWKSKTQHLPNKVREISAFEGLFTVYYQGGERLEIQRYRE